MPPKFLVSDRTDAYVEGIAEMVAAHYPLAKVNICPLPTKTVLGPSCRFDILPSDDITIDFPVHSLIYLITLVSHGSTLLVRCYPTPPGTVSIFDQSLNGALNGVREQELDLSDPDAFDQLFAIIDQFNEEMIRRHTTETPSNPPKRD